jgi:hypothetical protein
VVQELLRLRDLPSTYSVVKDGVEQEDLSGEADVRVRLQGLLDFVAVRMEAHPLMSFCYVSLDADMASTAATLDAIFGYGVAETTVENGDVEWNGTNSRVDVNFAGTYLVTGALLFAGASSGVKTVELKKNGVAFHTVNPYLHNATDPHLYNVEFPVECVKGDYIQVITNSAAGGHNLEASSTMSVRRIK